MFIVMIVTAYCLHGTMADGTQTRDGSIACPRAWKLGTEVVILGKTMHCRDRLAKRFDNRTDIWMPSCKAAKQFGKKKLRVEIK